MQFKKQSFTLVELLIVIAIIGILSAAVIFGVKRAVDNSRDARRLTDINNIAKALHSYYLDNGRYPTEGPPDNANTGGTGKIGEGQTGLINNIIRQYTSVVPTDPIMNSTYYYYYDGAHACGGNPNIALLFIHKMQTQTPAYPPTPCTSLGGEGGSTDSGAYWIILGPSSG